MDMDNSVVITSCRGWVEVGKDRGGIMMRGKKICKIKKKKNFHISAYIIHLSLHAIY